MARSESMKWEHEGICRLLTIQIPSEDFAGTFDSLSVQAAAFLRLDYFAQPLAWEGPFAHRLSKFTLRKIENRSLQQLYQHRIRDRAQNTKANDMYIDGKRKKALSNKTSLAFVPATATEF